MYTNKSKRDQKLLARINGESRLEALFRLLLMLAMVVLAVSILVYAGLLVTGIVEATPEMMGILWWLIGALAIHLLVWMAVR